VVRPHPPVVGDAVGQAEDDEVGVGRVDDRALAAGRAVLHVVGRRLGVGQPGQPGAGVDAGRAVLGREHLRPRREGGRRLEPDAGAPVGPGPAGRLRAHAPEVLDDGREVRHDGRGAGRRHRGPLPADGVDPVLVALHVRVGVPAQGDRDVQAFRPLGGARRGRRHGVVRPGREAPAGAPGSPAAALGLRAHAPEVGGVVREPEPGVLGRLHLQDRPVAAGGPHLQLVVGQARHRVPVEDQVHGQADAVVPGADQRRRVRGRAGDRDRRRLLAAGGVVRGVGVDVGQDHAQEVVARGRVRGDQGRRRVDTRPLVRSEAEAERPRPDGEVGRRDPGVVREVHHVVPVAAHRGLRVVEGREVEAVQAHPGFDGRRAVRVHRHQIQGRGLVLGDDLAQLVVLRAREATTLGHRLAVAAREHRIDGAGRGLHRAGPAGPPGGGSLPKYPVVPSRNVAVVEIAGVPVHLLAGVGTLAGPALVTPVHALVEVAVVAETVAPPAGQRADGPVEIDDADVVVVVPILGPQRPHVHLRPLRRAEGLVAVHVPRHDRHPDGVVVDDPALIEIQVGPYAMRRGDHVLGVDQRT